MNDQIKVKKLKVIDENGEQLGVMDTEKAQEIADSKGLDLVLVSPDTVNPVARIMDYGKMAFERAKKQKESKKNSKMAETKEIRLSANIATHDMNFKVKNAKEFLNKGNRVKVTMRFRGREIVKTDMGKEVLVKFAEELEEIADVSKQPSLEGKSMYMILSKKK